MTITETTEVLHVPVEQLHPSEENPRADLGDLDGLVASIHAVGIIEPLIVTEDQGVLGEAHAAYDIVCGHRRYAAAVAAGLATAPCIVRKLTTEQRIETMVVENLQREDLTPLDEARAMQWLVNLGQTQRQIAERVGCNQSHVSRRLSLGKLPGQATTWLTEGKLQLRQAEELAGVDDVEAVVALVAERGTVSDKDEEIRDHEISGAVQRLADAAKHAKALAAGEASALKRLDERPSEWGAGKHRPCKKAEATHWYLGDRDTKITWARTVAADTKAKAQAAKDGAPAQPPRSSHRDEWQRAQERRQERRTEVAGQRGEVLKRLLDDDLREVSGLDIVRANGLALLVELITTGGYGYDLRLTELRELVGDSGIADLSDDHAVLVGAAVLAWSMDEGIDVEENSSDDDKAVAETWNRLTALDVEPTIEEVAVVDLAPGEPELEILPYGGDPCDDEADERTRRPPWGTYQVVGDANLIKTINGIKDPDKLRHALVFEGSHTRRDNVTAAIAGRLGELEG